MSVFAMIPHNRQMRACPACSASGLRPVYHLDNVPIRSSIVLADAARAAAVPRGMISLAACEECGLLVNTSFDPTLVLEDEHHEDAQGCSATFTTFAQSIADDLIQQYNIRRKCVTEIGCGKGEFLAMMCTRGNNHGIGIDPAADISRLDAAVVDRIRIVKEPLGLHHASLMRDIVCCRHTLEHIANPLSFLTMLRRVMHRDDVPLFLEVPNAQPILQQRRFWDVYYEHCTYITAQSLRALLGRAGFAVERIEAAFDDQYLLATATPAASSRPSATVHTTPLDLADFAADGNALARRWRSWIEHRASAGEVVLWGSGSKAVGFLTATDSWPFITRVVDINPHKQGRFMPGGVRIVSPDALRSQPADAMIIMNPVYTDEIAALLSRLGCNTELVPLQLQVLSA